jgi:thymidylate synthase
VAGEFVHFIGNAHIYDDHIEPLKIQLKNDPYEFPDLVINEKRDNIDDYKNIEFNCFVVNDASTIDYPKLQKPRNIKICSIL